MAAGAAAPVAVVPGFERLVQLDTITVTQIRSGIDGSHYTVVGQGEILFYLKEDVSDPIYKGGSHRPFNIDGIENTGRKVFTFRRPCTWTTDKVELLMDEALVSLIRMEHTLTPIFRINDQFDSPVLRLKKQFSLNTVYQLQTKTKVTIGGVHKKFRGWETELFTYNDEYIITFPADLAVQYKIAVIVACVFVDFRFFEGK